MESLVNCLCKTSLGAVCLLLVCSFVPENALAQGLMSDFMGRPVFEKRYTEVKGSPYLSEEWLEGTVKLKGGKTFEKIKLKYDQVEDELMFLSETGKELLFVDPVEEFTLGDKTFRRGYPAADGASPNAFYEVLVEGGKAELLKRTNKKVMEQSVYNSATMVKSITSGEHYYLTVSNTGLTKLKKDKKSVLSALPGKNAELETYVKDNRLDLRQEKDMVKLVTYYNSL